MTDVNSMSTFEQYVLGTSALTPEQMEVCKVVQKALLGWGVHKTVEEVVLLKGLLDADRMGRIRAEIKEKWKITVPRPDPYSITDENDKAIQDRLVAQGPKTASQVLECRKIQSSAQQLGVNLKVSEILIAKGHFTPLVQGPAGSDDLLPEEPAPEKKPAPVPSRKPAAASKPTVTRDREPVTRTQVAPKKKNPLVLWLSIGGAAAGVLVVILAVILSGDSGPSAPVVRGEKILLWADGGGAVPLFTERRLLELHAGKAASGDLSAPSKTPVTALDGRLQTERGVWYRINTQSGTDGWVGQVYLIAGFDLKNTEVADFKSEWIRKLAALKAPPAVAKAPEPEPAKPVEPVPAVKEPPKPVDPSKPAEAAPKPAPTPEPVRPPEPPKPAEPDPVEPPQPAAVPALVAQWRFDDLPADATGSGHDGKLFGGPTWVSGRHGKAIAFDGTDDCVRVPRTPAIETPAVTIALWVKRQGNQGSWANVVRKTWRNSTGPTWASWSIQMSPMDGSANMISFNTGSSSATHHLHSKAALPDNAWVHVAAVYDPAGPAPQKRLYINGALDVSASATSPMLHDASPSGDLYFGQGGANKEWFKGAVDEARLYNHALSAEEIRDLSGSAPAAQAQPGPAPAKPGPPAGDPKKQAREAKAQAAWDAAVQLEKEGKLAEAQEKYREIRSRYRSTSVYFDKMIEITDRINELGQRLAVGALVKTTLHKRAHQDSWYSYEFVPPDGWKGVPPQPNWVGEQDNDETFHRGRTYQISRYTAPYFDNLHIVALKTFACESIDFLEQKVTGELEERYKGLKEESKVAGSGKAPYLRKTYVSTAGDRVAVYYFFGDRKGIALACIWRAGGEDNIWVRVTTISSTGTSTRKTKEHPVSEEDFKPALKVFDQVAKTFWFYDPATRQGKRVALDMGALCADWKILKSSKGGYIIEYATRDEYAKRAGEEMEQILGLYKAVIPSQKTIPPCRIKIFDREEDFQYYSLAFGAAAYWSPMQEEIVCYRFQGDKLKSQESNEEFTIAEAQNPEEVTFKVLYHEGFHQYMYFYMGRDRGVYVPSWLNEGMGDYFFGGEWSKTGGKKFDIGLNDWRLKTIYNAVKEDKHVALDKLIRYEQRQYYANASLCYAEGWALNYFFQKSEVGKKKGYYAIPRQMLHELKASGNWERATDKVFGGIDLKKMEEEFKEFVLSFPAPKDKDEGANQ